MIVRIIVGVAAVLACSGCVVRGTTLPTTLSSDEAIEITVRLESQISFGNATSVAPNLCVNAPEEWEIEALSFIGHAESGLISGEPRLASSHTVNIESPEGYQTLCWVGPRNRYTLESHGKVRMRVRPIGSGPANITFVAGYEDQMSFHTHEVTVEVIDENADEEVEEEVGHEV